MYTIDWVIGAGYGNEGKGHVAAMLAEDYKKSETIVVLCNAGVSRTNHYKNYEFIHFGSPTMDDVATYISSQFICDPLIFKQQYEELTELGHEPKVFLDNKCRLVMPYHRMLTKSWYFSTTQATYTSLTGVYDAWCYDVYRKDGVACDSTIQFIKNKENFDAALKYYNREECIRLLKDLWRNEDYEDMKTVADAYYDKCCSEAACKQWYEAFEFMIEHSTLVNGFQDLFDKGYKHFIGEMSHGLSIDEGRWDDQMSEDTPMFGHAKPLRHFETYFEDKKYRVTYNFVTRWYLTKYGYSKDNYGHDVSVYPDRNMFGERNSIYIDTICTNKGIMQCGAINFDEIFSNITDCVNLRGDFNVRLFVTHIKEYDNIVPVWRDDEDSIQYYTMNGFLKLLRESIHERNSLILSYGEDYNDVIDYDCKEVEISNTPDVIVRGGLGNRIVYASSTNRLDVNSTPVTIRVDETDLSTLSTAAESYTIGTSNTNYTNWRDRFSEAFEYLSTRCNLGSIG